MVAPGIEPGISGSVANNSDQYTKEAVPILDDSLNIYDIPSIRHNAGLKTILPDNISVPVSRTY
jgi:hypothetical protein